MYGAGTTPSLLQKSLVITFNGLRVGSDDERVVTVAREGCLRTTTLQKCEAVPRRARIFQAHRLLYHSTLGLRVITKKKMPAPLGRCCWRLQWLDIPGSAWAAFADEIINKRISKAAEEAEQKPCTVSSSATKLLREGATSSCDFISKHL